MSSRDRKYDHVPLANNIVLYTKIFVECIFNVLRTTKRHMETFKDDEHAYCFDCADGLYLF